MPAEELKAELRQYFTEAQADEGLSALDVDLRAKAVISELQNPAGLQEHEEAFESGLEDILRDHEAEGALTLVIAASEALAELRNPGAATEDGGYQPVDPPLPPENVPAIEGLEPTSWPVDDDTGTLTVTGTNFHPLSIIHLNNLQRPTTWVSESEITCAIPSFPQPVTVSVSVDTAGMASQAVPFEYTAVL